MLYTTRRAASAALNTSLLTITTATDIVCSTLTTVDKGIYWCSSKIEENMSDSAKKAWLEHEAQLRGFTSADAFKKYTEAVNKKVANEEEQEIKNLEESK